ncbi:MAG: S41 family peptidase [Defluviitaleaceae bacterium]|nr:S41 family peptidase [Defluviitaleaceae bacterium]
MRKAKTTIVALILAFAISMPAIAFIQPLVVAADTAQPSPEEMGFIPVRAIFEELGGIVTWDAEERVIHIAIDDVAIVLFANQALAYVNGSVVALQDGVVLWQDRSFISETDLMSLQRSLLPTITFTLTEEARDIVLYDFDYMINAILLNSPWESVLNRRIFEDEGFSFAEFTAMLRRHIEGMNPLTITMLDEDSFRASFPIQDGDDARSIAANYLYALLAFEFAPILQGIGHLMPRDLTLYTALLTGFVRQYEQGAENQFTLPLLLDAFTHPSAIWFYGEVDVDLDAQEHSFPIVPDNILTDIIVPGEIAFMRINTFISNPEFDDLIILPFLQEVQDFNHIIIDLRGNGGGLMTYFHELILRRLINDTVKISSHEFFSSGNLAFEFVEATLNTALQAESAADWVELVHVSIMPADDFIYQRGMRYFNADDLERLDYVMLSQSAFFPDDSVNFEGKIWLLVDGFSMSAAALATNAALYTGFATVVGENTSGVMGSMHIYLPLPNTGIIWRIDVGYQTDAYGRSLEVYGIAPQIRNFDGLDALHTVLAIIAGGNY